MAATAQKGFTLVELSVVLALVAIFATIAVPSFVNTIRDNQLQAQAEEFNALLQYARSESVIRRRAVNVAINDGVLDVRAGGQSLRTITVGSNVIDVDVSSTLITFRPNGTSSTGVFTAAFCRDNKPELGYVVSVLGSGRVTLHPRGRNENGTALGSCSV